MPTVVQSLPTACIILPVIVLNYTINVMSYIHYALYALYALILLISHMVDYGTKAHNYKCVDI